MAANEAPLTFFTAQGSNANSAGQAWPGGWGVFAAWGTFGAGTCALQWSPDSGTTWIAVDRSGDSYVTFTANGSGRAYVPAGQVRGALTGATAPSLNATFSAAR